MHPILFNAGPVTIYSYGVLLAASHLLGLRLAMWRAKKWGLDANRVLDLGIYCINAARQIFGVEPISVHAWVRRCARITARSRPE